MCTKLASGDFENLMGTKLDHEKVFICTKKISPYLRIGLDCKVAYVNRRVSPSANQVVMLLIKRGAQFFYMF